MGVDGVTQTARFEQFVRLNRARVEIEKHLNSSVNIVFVIPKDVETRNVWQHDWARKGKVATIERLGAVWGFSGWLLSQATLPDGMEA